MWKVANRPRVSSDGVQRKLIYGTSCVDSSVTERMDVLTRKKQTKSDSLLSIAVEFGGWMFTSATLKFTQSHDK